MMCSVFIASSVDGYIARSDGNIDWLTSATQEDDDYGYKTFYDSIDCLVIGRKTYETARTFGQWPYIEKRVVVLSTKPNDVPNMPGHNVQIVSSAPSQILEILESAGCRHAYIDGGKTIQSFLGIGLVDEITITAIPILLGEGIRLFGILNRDIKLRLLETKAYKNGFVQTKYSTT